MNEDTLPPLQSVVYAWGYGSPSLPLFRQYGGASEAARAVAMTRGWDPDREGAWAIEITLPARHDLARLAVAAEAQRDPAVMGWALVDDEK
jgi:hypothetical protein